MSARLCLLDRESVRIVILATGLKMWWVAEQIGVHKTTLRRWLNGKTLRLRRIHHERLIRLLTANASPLVTHFG